MELILAKTNIEEKAQKITLEDLAQKLDSNHNQIFYFDRANNHKDLLKATSFFQSKGRNAYLSEVKFGLDEKDYIYELHIV
ncbi:HP0268 family nuclease [Helicobacter cappadocius]|uniref:HP0268 family nuclease n=1 Tax=Helicobacter cappadocius TaxID=3063998 RepID=A0AA90Q134_9HELI|nr:MULTISPECIES: HP0268 family nuclease [unclassified Helicobacter]MDO7252316.1 HP0268 family nuclease [Helicobacter sp. faydin-H75]MDP2538183.1 HP0268 family nuclease [Helicobacter sp. faydin-H76]